MSLQEEISDLLASYNTPMSTVRQMALAIRQIEKERIAPGIDVGQPAPDFELPNSQGRAIRLSEKLRHGPAVVTFFRGAWCPICSLQVAALVRALPEIRATGGCLIGVHPDAGPLVDDPQEGFELCSDPHQQVIEQWRVQFEMPPALQRYYLGEVDTDISKYNLDGTWRLPVPATFVVDQSGVVRKRHVTADFTNRMEPEAVVAALQEIAGAVSSNTTSPL